MGYRTRLFMGCNGHIETEETFNDKRGQVIGPWEFLRTMSDGKCFECQSGKRDELESKWARIYRGVMLGLALWHDKLPEIESPQLRMTYYPDDLYLTKAQMHQHLTWGGLQGLVLLGEPQLEGIVDLVQRINMPEFWVAVGFLSFDQLDKLVAYSEKSVSYPTTLSDEGDSFTKRYSSWAREVLEGGEGLTTKILAFSGRNQACWNVVRSSRVRLVTALGSPLPAERP